MSKSRLVHELVINMKTNNEASQFLSRVQSFFVPKQNWLFGSIPKGDHFKDQKWVVIRLATFFLSMWMLPLKYILCRISIYRNILMSTVLQRHALGMLTWGKQWVRKMCCSHGDGAKVGGKDNLYVTRRNLWWHKVHLVSLSW